MAKFRIVIEGEDNGNEKTHRLATELLQRTTDRFYQNGVIVQSTFTRGGDGAPNDLEAERAKRHDAEAAHKKELEALRDAHKKELEALKKKPA
jgi:hypothetical protein